MEQKLKPHNQILQNTDVLNSKFRYDINALRAIAVIGVVFFHYKIKGFTGGFAGVDVFFVISGYLMSKIIINAVDNKNFSFVNFCQKRLQRIVPSLLFLIVVLSILCFFIYLPDDYKNNQKNAAASILFLSNVLYWKNSNYFDPASDTNIFLHTWSLSVEWQFYLVYPIVILALKKIVKNNALFMLVFLMLTFILFIISLLATTWKPIPSFYLLPTRAWEMLFGGICFFFQDKIKDNDWKMRLALLGYGVILLSFVLLDSNMPWPSFYTLIPVIATSLIIICNYNGFKIVRETKTQFIGSISYSLYLWHWPVYVVSQYIGVELNVISQLLFCLISVTIAYASYKYIESLNISSRLIVCSAIIVFAATALSSRFYANRLMFKVKALEMADYANSHSTEIARQMDMGHCFIVHNMPESVVYDKKTCLCMLKNEKNFLLIGDSHAAHLSESLRDSLKAKNINLLQAAASGGMPVIKNNGLERFESIIKYVYYDFIPNNSSNISVVMISADWAGEKMNKVQLISALKETVNYLKKYGVNVVIIGQNETYSIPYTTIAAKDIEYGTDSGARYLNKYSYEINDALKLEFKENYIDIINKKNFPHSFRGTIPYMVDGNHFSVYGAGLATHKILSNPTIKLLVGDIDL